MSKRIIASPGRLLHHLIEVEMSLSLVEYIVFDEADRLFEFGFADQINEILKRVSANRQTILMSATMPKQLVEFAKAGLQNPTLIRLDAESKISEVPLLFPISLPFFFITTRTSYFLLLLLSVCLLLSFPFPSFITDTFQNQNLCLLAYIP